MAVLRPGSASSAGTIWVLVLLRAANMDGSWERCVPEARYVLDLNIDALMTIQAPKKRRGLAAPSRYDSIRRSGLGGGRAPLELELGVQAVAAGTAGGHVEEAAGEGAVLHEGEGL